MNKYSISDGYTEKLVMTAHFGTEYCGDSEYEGCCELAECLDSDMRLITEEHYDYESKSRPAWCPLKPLPEKMKVTGLYNGEYFKAGGKPPSYKIGWNNCIDAITKEVK